MSKSLISLGANLGNPRQLIELAGEMILDRFGSSNVAFSRLYRTPAVGGPSGQDDFYNAVATIDSNQSVFEIWRGLHDIEQLLGRRRRDRWEARRIDLDVLLHDHERHWTPTLKIPHPRMLMRTFVLEPACEIAGDWIEPVTGQRIADLSQRLQQARAKEQLGHHAIHILVLTESTERIRLIAQSLISDHQATTFDPAIPESLDGGERFIVRMNGSRQITLQSMAPLLRTNSKSQFEDIRFRLNRQIMENELSHPLQLLVFAGASPDPEAIHWEDYCRNWAELFELITLDGRGRLPPSLTLDRQEPPPPSKSDIVARLNALRRLPKYLLSADDPAWAAHELRAAMTAMTCPIQSSGAFFDDRKQVDPS